MVELPLLPNIKTLMLWRDLTPLPHPLVKSGRDSKSILIIGGGVTGMITAWALLDRGYRVTIISKEWPSYGKAPRITSPITSTLLEYPLAICDQHTDIISFAHSTRWRMVSYHVYNAIASDPHLSRASGISMMPRDSCSPKRVEDDVFQLKKVKEIMTYGVLRSRRGREPIAESGIKPEHGENGCGVMAPVIDTDVGMSWLMELVQSKGALRYTETVRGDLFDQEDQILSKYGADVLVNCTGRAGAELAGDQTCCALRGGPTRAQNFGIALKVKASLSIPADVAGADKIVLFDTTSSQKTPLLGAKSSSAATAQRMKACCEALLRHLKNTELDPKDPFAQGLRPFRHYNARVERELRRRGHIPSRIVHSYGQGDARWSLGFGCAGDVLELVEEVLMRLPARPMDIQARL